MIQKRTVYCTENTVPFRNLAVEAYLLHRVVPGEVILYLWQNRKTVVVGKNQNAWAECRVRELEEAGGFLVRRLSGGGAVFHDMGNLNFTFLARDEDYDVTRQVSVIQKAVETFGLHAQQTGRNDLVIDGAKFSGNAYYRSGVFRYHHGTILLHVDTTEMARFLTPSQQKLEAKGVKSVQSRVVNLQTLVPSITVPAMKEALVQAFGAVYGGLPTLLTEAELEEEEIARWEAKFTSPQWRYHPASDFTWRSEVCRLPLGMAQLCVQAADGSVKSAVLYTDALDDTLSDRVAQLLDGIPFSGEAMEQRLREADCGALTPLLKTCPL